MYQSQTVIGRTQGSKDLPLSECVWPEDGLHYIPDWVYTSQEVYDREMKLIFQGDTWNYVALEAEIPNSGDYKRSIVGDVPVVVSRAEDGTITDLENSCAHRAAESCRERQQHTNETVSPHNTKHQTTKANPTR